MSKKTVLDSVSNTSEFRTNGIRAGWIVLINFWLNKPPGPPLKPVRGFGRKSSKTWQQAVLLLLTTSWECSRDHCYSLGNARQATWKSWNEPTTLRIFLVPGLSAQEKHRRSKPSFSILARFSYGSIRHSKDEKSKWVAGCNKANPAEQYAGKWIETRRIFLPAAEANWTLASHFPPEPKNEAVYHGYDDPGRRALSISSNPKGFGTFRDRISGFIKDFNRFAENGGDRGILDRILQRQPIHRG